MARPNFNAGLAEPSLNSCTSATSLPWMHPPVMMVQLSGMQGGGVRLNNVKVESEQHVLSEEDLIEGRLVLIAAGKKNKMLVRIGS